MDSLHSIVGEDDLLDLVGSIYDCVIAPERWAPTLDQLRGLFNFQNAMLVVHSVYPLEMRMRVTSGISQSYMDRLNDFGPDVQLLWGGAEHIARLPVYEPLVRSQVVPQATWENNRYYREWVRPQGDFDTVAMHLSRDPSLNAVLAFGRSLTDGAFLDEELVLLRQLAPHFRRAVTIAGLLENTRAAAATFAAALEISSSAIVLVDAGMRIIHANGAAEAMLKQGDPVVSRGSRLVLSAWAPQELLQSAVAIASQPESRMGSRGIGIPAYRRNGSPVVVHVLPLLTGRIGAEARLHASAAVFIAPASQASKISAEALGLLFELTPTEARVFELVAAGHSVRETAELLGSAISTVKTHLRRVFDKTGRHRQAELVKLAADLFPTI